jgi:hypothetical protein
LADAKCIGTNTITKISSFTLPLGNQGGMASGLLRDGIYAHCRCHHFLGIGQCRSAAMGTG